ncbi:hypothetical protein PIB30_041433 [Stylosanthes scabra]|uniref:Uncharacterized protein n=1 Tax=Stylosanthes scabra TaxID=79078 RepID=A0ABU6WEN2_9FABA|nr:hypothetical protein [Stylosanthes scabra]
MAAVGGLKSSPSVLLLPISRILNDCPKDFEWRAKIQRSGQEDVPSVTSPTAWLRAIAEKGLM